MDASGAKKEPSTTGSAAKGAASPAAKAGDLPQAATAKATTAKTAAAKTTATAKAATAKTSTTRPAAAKEADTKPEATQTTARKTAGTRTASAKTATSKSTATAKKPAATKPATAKTATTKAPATKTAATKTTAKAATTTAAAKSADTKAADTKSTAATTTAATKTTAAKSTTVKTAAAKTTAAKAATAKGTTAKAATAKSAAAPAATKTTGRRATTKTTAKATTKTATKATTKTAAKPAAKTAAKPATKTAAKSSTRTAAKTAASPHFGERIQAAAANDPAAPTAPIPAPYAAIGRIPIMDVMPQVQNGSWPAKATEREAFPVQATVWRDGHDLFACEAVLVGPDGAEVQASPMELIRPGLGRYQGWLTPPTTGNYGFFVRSWSDPLATWKHNAEAKLPLDQDVALVFLEAEQLLHRVLERIPEDTPEHTVISDALGVLTLQTVPKEVRYAAATSSAVEDVIRRYPLRDMLTESAVFPLEVDRERALVGSWYEMFPRSVGAWQDDEGEWHSGTLRSAAEDLPRIAGLGFDVVYLTPISPIGLTARKGKNNSLTAQPGEPGSPYAIGSEAGGHDAIHPDLGTFEDFDYFVEQARKEGLEVALDLALQCSPDHPWLKEHPEWFLHRPDGTIAYAENPPKKYQDIYPLNFDDDPEGIYQEIKRVLEVWVSHGVTIFRVDNPHTKPLPFWQRLLAEFRIEHPEVIFLAEAFTAPPMMQGLAAIGFHQSYCYFAWRNEKEEIEEYLLELGRETAHVLRPAFWPTTHDILTPYMQTGGPNAWKIRAILAATGSPTWGIYSGYEFVEDVPRPGFEEMIDNEKYEYRPRDYSQDPHGIQALFARLNKIRREHTALQRLRGININKTTNDQVLSFTKHARAEETPDGVADSVIVVLNLDPHNTQEAVLHLDLTPLEVAPRNGAPIIEVTDELTGNTFYWNEEPFVRLDPSAPAHILSVKVLK